MKTKLLIATFLAVALIFGWAVRSSSHLAQATAERDALAARGDEMRQQVRALEVRLQRADAAFGAWPNESAPKVEASGTPAPPTLARGQDQTQTEHRGRPLNPMTLITSDPRKLKEHLENVRASVELGSGPVFRAIGASREQIEKLKEVEVALEQTKLDLQAAVDLHQVDPNSAAYKKLLDDNNRARLAKKAEVLGELTSRYVDFVRNESAWELARMLAVTGKTTGELATADQIDRAAAVLGANCKRWTNDAYAGWTDVTTINWDVAAEQLKTLLTPGQIEIIRLQIERAKVKAGLDGRTKRLTAEFKKQTGAR